MHGGLFAKFSLPIVTAAALLGSASGDAPKLKVVNVIARDFALEMPASIPAGPTIIQFHNVGTQKHHMVIMRLDSGKTAAEGLKAIMAAGRGRKPAWLHPFGGPQAALPGTGTNAALILEPGNYLAFCEIPGPDPAPHFMKGMAKAFTVTGPSHPGPLPRPDVTISLTDYDFTFDKPLTAGIRMIAVTNKSTQGHMMVLTRFEPGQGVKDFTAWARDPKGSLGPGQTMGGVTEIAPGMTVVFGQRILPGHYGMVCFTPDVADGKPHFQHGMSREFDIP